MIELSDIHKSYQLGSVTLDILRGVCLSVQPGDLLSIVGPSGCGKSTLLNILGLLDRPSSGAYRLADQEVQSMSDDECATVRNARIGFVFQSFHLLPKLTAQQNVGLPLVYRGLPSTEVRERALAELERVGMADRADHRPNELSGGQQQRVALARALVGEPVMILADEPTGALDPTTSGEIMVLFETLCSESGMTIIIVTHSPDVARRCSRNCRMDAGLLEEVAGRAAGAVRPAQGTV